MVSTLIVCASTMFLLADSTAQSQPAGGPQPAAQTPATRSAVDQTAKPQQPAAGAAAKKSDQQAGTVDRAQADPPKTEAKPERKPDRKLELLAIEQNIIDCTNTERARFGLPIFVVDPNLMATARQHCTWMTTYRQLVHTHLGVAENIAMGQSSSQEVLRCWMNSPGHRANILNAGHRRIGVAAYRTPEGTIYWCQQFTP